VTILENMRASPESYRSAFVLARQKVIERMLVNSTSSAEVISQLAYLARFDLPDSFYDIMARDVASLTLADFHPFLVKELPAEKQVFGAFGNAAPVAQAIEAARAVKPATRRGVVDPFQ
ncbi:MAG TPA: hypothetical protein VK427_25390, partial [Kofleriaceae bacterium]|nr:hypothetical protein [Kofleriaceae bacterium]